MITRDVFRWNVSPLDCLAIASIALAGCVLRLLDMSAMHVDRWLDLAATALG